jgi:hypothetical protein
MISGQAPAFTSGSSATFTVGSAGSFQVTTTGVPANTISLGTGTGCAKLPTGVTLSGTGNTATLAGTPAAGTGGTYAICLTASNGVGAAATQAFTLNVIGQSPQSITPSTPPASASVGGPTYTPSATASSGLPVAITLDSSSTGCALSSGGVVSFTGAGACVIDFNQAGNAAYAPAPLVQQSIPVAMVNEVDDAPSAAVSYTGSGWTHGQTGCQNVDCTESFSPTAGDTVSFTFTGTTVQWIAPRSNNGGYANVYLDGVLVASNVTTYAAATTYQQVIWSDQGLSSGTHTLKIVVLGTKPAASTNTYVQVDAFIAKPALLEVDDAPSAAVSYTGSGWTHGQTGCVNVDCTESFSPNTGDTVTFTFSGTGVEWIAPRSNNGGYANVYLDGVLVASNVTTYAAATTYQQVIWSDQGLSNGPHTLKIVVLGTKPAASTNTYVQIDAFLAT